MAYLSKEETKRMRDYLKKVFPSKDGWKLSVRNEHSTSVYVKLVKGLFEYDGRYNLSRYKGWNDDESANENIFRDIVLEVLEIASPNYDNSDIQTDYFDVGYYINLSIGDYDKEYEYNPKTELDWDIIRDRVKKLRIINKLKKAS
jgi:hypothetical protein